MRPFNDLLGRVLLPPIVAAVERKFDEWMPKLAKVLIVAAAHTTTKTIVDVENKVTDLIPGELDDQVLDPIVADIMTRANEIVGGLFGGPQ